MNTINTNYKIVILNSNKTPTYTFVFSSGNTSENLSKLFVNPIYSNQQIHLDDTIQIVKKKLLKEFIQIKPISYEEIYMFSYISRTIPTQLLFDSISDSSSKSVSPIILKQVLSNLDISIQLEENLTTSIFYEEFMSLFGGNDKITVKYKIALDKQFQNKHDERFSANPFDILPKSTDIFTDNAENPLITLDNIVLLNHNGGKFIDNTIYVCLTEDVLQYCCKENGWDEYAILKMYFSRMVSIYDIHTSEKWLENRQIMISETQKMMNESMFQTTKIVDLFYDMNINQPNFEYLERGIQSITVGILPTVSIGLPLETIFKKIHAVESVPFIKFNPGFRRENMYRLYSDKLTKKGEKVPFMRKNLILRLANELGRKKIISFYTYDTNSEIFVDIESNGHVKIRGRWGQPMNMADISQQLADRANPILYSINEFLASSGHVISLFESLNQSNIRIGELTYFWKTRIRPNTIQLNKLANCLRPIFEIYDKDAKLEDDDGVTLRFKRVDNYRDMDAQEIYINEMYQKTGDIVKVKELFKDHFRISEEDAVEKLTAYFNNEYRAEDIADSPGFPVRMKVENFNGAIFYAQVNIAKHIEYVDILNMYIEGLLRITQDKTNVGILKQMNELCMNSLSKKKAKQREPTENVIKNVEIVERAPIVPLFNPGNLLEQEFGITDVGSFEEERDEDEEEPNIDSIEFEEEMDGGKEVDIETDNFPENQEFEKLGYEFEGDNEIYDENDLNGKNISSLINVLGRMQEKDPILFNYKHVGVNKGKFTSYARACQGSLQPMILTDEEKKRIDETNRDSYEHAVRYGSNPDKQYWYICPRFWCLKTNRPISEKEVKEGKCGKVLPKGASHILTGHYVYEFDRNGHNTPGFFKEKDRHPQGYCLPCCFKKPWTNQGFVDRRAECMKNEEMSTAVETNDENELQNVRKTNVNYIRNIHKFPLEPQRWGFLPVSIQRMLQIQSNMSNNVLSSNKKTMLRYGVEKSENKSFIACIADVYATEKNLKDVPSILEMCDILANAISIDVFLRAHNGSLPSMFQPKQFDYASIDYRKYDSSQFIQSIEKADDAQEDFMNDTIASYENFLLFLTTPETVIDYTYLWDIISMPNPLLFSRGINLAILEIPDSDATEHIEVVCPTVAYSSAIYDPRKETLILTKRKSETNDEIVYFEPVYLYDKKQITRTFSTHTQVKPIQQFLQIIRNFSQKKCGPLNSIPKQYTFERNKSAKEIIDICKQFNIILLAQVLNFQGKLVALFVQRTPTSPKIYLPCAPSAIIMTDLSIIYIDEADKLWQNYATTRDELAQIAEISENNILCRPIIKVIEDQLIVGILTETNQFVMINPPEENHAIDGLKELKEINYVLADIDLANKRQIDKLRERTIKMIQLEKYFYQVFRTTLRIVLQQPNYINEKVNIIKEIENLTYENYNTQFQKVETWLHNILDAYVQFQKYDESVLLALNEISDCFSGNANKPYCIFTPLKSNRGLDDSSSSTNFKQLIIPERNLISGKPNQRIYFKRLADELLRYKRVRSMILDKHAYVVQTDEYQLNVDEMILLEYMMSDYLGKDLVPIMKIKDAHISYEFANPYKRTIKYSNEVKLAEQKTVQPNNVYTSHTPIGEKKTAELSVPEKEAITQENDLKLECVKESKEVTGNSTNIWKQFFPKESRELFLNPSVNCTYYPLLIIYKKVNRTLITIPQIKQLLVKIYKQFSNYESKILHVLSLQGKRDMMQKVAKKETNLEDVIMSNMYPLSNLDYWAICRDLKLPVILFTSMKSIKHLLEVSWLRLGENTDYRNLEYYFIRAPTEKDSKKGVNEVHAYSLITPGISMEDMQGFQEIYGDAIMEESDNLIDLPTYLSEKYI